MILTDAQDKALSSICVSTQEWINNAVAERARVATLVIVDTVIAKCTETNTPIPATQALMVELAFTNGWVLIGDEKNANAAIINQEGIK
jgi:hypothetical protein